MLTINYAQFSNSPRSSFCRITFHALQGLQISPSLSFLQCEDAGAGKQILMNKEGHGVCVAYVGGKQDRRLINSLIN